MRAKYITEWFPSLIEESIEETVFYDTMSEEEMDQLRIELGIMLFPEFWDRNGDNGHMASRDMGYLGAEIKKWKEELTKNVVKQSDIQ